MGEQTNWRQYVPKATRLDRLADWAYQKGILLARIFQATFQGKTASATVPVAGKLDPSRDPVKIISIGNSHIDAAWMWRASDTRDKKINVTFARALHHLDRYPKFTFSQNQAVYYAWVKEYYPDIFAEIQRYADGGTGRWDVTGGDWVETDVNLPCGESLVRQRLYGQRWLLEHLGFLAELAWSDDVFGFPPTLPQILVKSGAKWFWTNKFCYNDTNRFPLHTFRWRGSDGTELLTHWVQHKNNFAKYLKDFELYSPLLPPGRENTLNYASDLEAFHAGLTTGEYVPVLGNFYGVGDGGNGPQPREILEQLAWDEAGLVECGTTRKLYEHLAPFAARVPVWADELYLENHRGTLTSIRMIKENNKTSEILLQQLETLATFAVLAGQPTLQPQISQQWLPVLFCQFHDVLPGSSIIEVYRDCARDYDALYRWVYEALSRLLEAPGSNSDCLTLINTLSWPRGDMFVVPAALLETGSQVVELEAPDGTLIPLQRTCTIPFVTNRLLLGAPIPPTGFEYQKNTSGLADLDAWREFPREHYAGILPVRSVPGFGFSTYQTRPSKDAIPDSLPLVVEDAQYLIIENSGIRVTLDRQTGSIQTITPVNHPNQNVLGEGGIALRLFEDPATAFDAWNLHPEYRDHPVPLPAVSSITIEENGPVVTTVRVELHPTEMGTTFAYRISLFKNLPRVYFDIVVDWQEEWRLLRFEVDSQLAPENIRCAQPYGFIDRPTSPHTSCERARWEFASHAWTTFRDPSVREGFNSITLLDQGVYGTSVSPSGFGVSLLKSAKFINHTDAATLDPDKDDQPNYIDRGFHRIPLALQFDLSGVDAATPFHMGWEYNTPLLAVRGVPGNLPSTPISVEGDDIWVSVVKLADPPVPGQENQFPLVEGNEIPVILRVVECAGNATTGAISIDANLGLVSRAWEVDLLERALSDRVPLGIQTRDGRHILNLELGPFEIKTLHVTFKQK